MSDENPKRPFITGSTGSVYRKALMETISEISAIEMQAEDESWMETEESEEVENEKFATYRQSTRIYVAFVICIGIVGNAACLVLYRRPKFCRYRSSRYLTALAVSDLTSLICLGLIWLKGLGLRWQDRSDLACTASVYASNSATFLSAWYVMLLTADMAWVLRRPYRISIFEERKSIVGRILAVTFVGLVANSWTWTAAKIIPSESSSYDTQASFIFFQDPFNNVSFQNESSKFPKEIYTNNEGGCQLTFNDDEYFARCMIIFDMTVSFTIPLLVTLVLNGYIGYKLMSSARRRRLLSQQVAKKQLVVVVASTTRRGGTSRSNYRAVVQRGSYGYAERHAVFPLTVPKQQIVVRRRKSFLSGLGKEATVSSLLIAKSLTYLILNLPTHAYRLWSILRTPPETVSENEKESEFILNMIVYVLFYTQFSLNFLLYSGHACKKRGNN